MKTDVKPYFVPSDESVTASPWLRQVDGELEPLGETIENWDYRTEVHLRCAVTIDAVKVRAQSGLTDGSPISLVLGYRALDTYLAGPNTVIPLYDGTSEVELTIDPDHAGSVISVTRRLVLARDRLAAAPGEARHAGSVLWEDAHPLRLTGSLTMFPTEVVDFEAFGLNPNTSWHALQPPSPDAPAMGALLLLLNANDTKLVAAVQKERRLSEEQQFLVEHMEENLVLEIVRWALARWDELAATDEQSFGASARALTKRVLPDPETWSLDSLTVASIDLRTAVIGGARALGFGRSLS
ncbi:MULTISPECIES: hypothetical protein [Gordonia]|uniref:hypothetical protein n=1 Tax=Gordonia TaxID=2053 RepID=UPI0002A6255A|nr:MULTISPECIES: hypothetical protein [Gordonia]NKX80151.1 hypothetical protein [Gordonia amicalis]GAC55723.1 hypothetical protein GOAMI_66_00060 [Gordonia amicalis NBRC 100051 = JCM 11271]